MSQELRPVTGLILWAQHRLRESETPSERQNYGKGLWKISLRREEGMQFAIDFHYDNEPSARLKVVVGADRRGSWSFCNHGSTELVQMEFRRNPARPGNVMLARIVHLIHLGYVPQSIESRFASEFAIVRRMRARQGQTNCN